MLRYKSVVTECIQAKDIVEGSNKYGDTALTKVAKISLKNAAHEIGGLAAFKEDVDSIVNFYECMSKIVDYDDDNLKKFVLFARNLRPMLGGNSAG